MGVAFADYDQDGLSTSTSPTTSSRASSSATAAAASFEETGLLAGVALPEHGQEISAMGADFRDYDNDGRPDIHVTALAGESYPAVPQPGQGPVRGRRPTARG